MTMFEKDSRSIAESLGAGRSAESMLILLPRLLWNRWAGPRWPGMDTTGRCTAPAITSAVGSVLSCCFCGCHEDAIILLPNALTEDGDSSNARSRVLTIRLRVFMVESLEYTHTQINSAIISRLLVNLRVLVAPLCRIDGRT